MPHTQQGTHRIGLLAAAVLAALVGSCMPEGNARLDGNNNAPTGTSAGAPAATEAPPTQTSTPQSTSTPASFGPSAADFPENINPLSGMPVAVPALLGVPAVLVSISHFPPEGRPQAGLSFAPFVYEFSITRGETRFLAVFHGQWPAVEQVPVGKCRVRWGAFKSSDVFIGNQVWLDVNRNGIHEFDEPGVGGVCISVRDATGQLLGTTTSDSNGVYGFNVDAGAVYRVEFERPLGMEFTIPDVGLDDADSDVLASAGWAQVIVPEAGTVDLDAGLVLTDASSLSSDPGTIPARAVGPVRSGRLLYRHLAASYTNSCLIYAFASPEILERLPHCAFVAHEEVNGGEMISIERLRAVAEDNMRHTADREFNYASNLYSEVPPPGGVTADQLRVVFSKIDESGWIYDPLYEAYLRYVDDADPLTSGVLHPEIDRLTGRQLHFENVVIVMADTEVVSRTNLDIHLDGGNSGPAKLFRDGKLYAIEWSTRGGEYEQHSGLRRPIQFVDKDGAPVPLKPGSTWVIIVTPFSLFEVQASGAHMIRYAPPVGEAQ